MNINCGDGLVVGFISSHQQAPAIHLNLIEVMKALVILVDLHFKQSIQNWVDAENACAILYLLLDRDEFSFCALYSWENMCIWNLLVLPEKLINYNLHAIFLTLVFLTISRQRPNGAKSMMPSWQLRLLII